MLDIPLAKILLANCDDTMTTRKRPVRPCWRSHYDQSALVDFDVFRLNAVRSLKNDCGRSENFLGRKKVSNYCFQRSQYALKRLMVIKLFHKGAVSSLPINEIHGTK